MNFVILKNTIKRNWKLMLVFLAVLCFYLSVILYLVDPADMEKVKDLFGMIGGMLDAFGINTAAMTSPLAYTASTFFSVLVMAFTMVFYVIQTRLLVLKPVDDTSIAYTLSAPVTRTSLILTQGFYLIGAMFVLFTGILVTGCAWLGAMGDFDFPAYLNLVSVTFLLSTAVAMLSFFFSAAFCGTKLGSGLAAGVPIGLLILSMIVGAGGDKLKWLENISPFSWLDSVGIVSGNVDTWWMYPSFLAAIVLLLAASVWAFKRKQLPI